MTKRKIIIQLGNKRKVFEVISKKYDELLSLDLQLSSVSTPQPPVEESSFVAWIFYRWTK